MADAQALLARSMMVVIPGRPPNLGNARLHWAARARLVANTRDKAWGLMVSRRNELRLPVAKEWRVLRITVYLSGVGFDLDNLHSAIKPYADAASLAGWIRDDSPQWCELKVVQVTGAPRIPRSDQRVEIGVTW